MAERSFTVLANYLAHAAKERRLVTYGEMSKEFGGANQGWGPVLTEIGERLRENGLPVLPVIVVSKGTGEPSADATFYRRLGLDADGIAHAQRECFDHPWERASFWRDEP